MDLQQVLDRFKADIESYIKEEVARQIATQSGGTEARSVVTNNHGTETATSAADIQASLDELAVLAQSGKKGGSSDQVDKFISEFGMQSPQVSEPEPVSAVNDAVINIKALSSLQSLGQRNYGQTQSSALDELSSLSSSSTQAETIPQPPQPPPSAVTDTSNTAESEQMSGIQSFLQKIRQRKNLRV